MSERPVLLVHGWGSSFDRTWVATGVSALLEDAGRTVIGVDLLGHGDAPKPHDPEAYADLTERLVDALPADGTVDAVGFSLGARTSWSWRRAQPDRFGRIVVAGVGDSLFARDEAETDRLIAGVRGEAPDSDVRAQAFRALRRAAGQRPGGAGRGARAPGRAVHRGRRWPRWPARCWWCWATVTSPAPGDRLAAALPDARLVSLAQRGPLRHARVLRLHRRHARVPRRRPAR